MNMTRAELTRIKAVSPAFIICILLNKIFQKGLALNPARDKSNGCAIQAIEETIAIILIR